MSDPRGPIRTITAIDARNDGTTVTLSCGHEAHLNQIFHYNISEEHRCMKCRRETQQ